MTGVVPRPGRFFFKKKIPLASVCVYSYMLSLFFAFRLVRFRQLSPRQGDGSDESDLKLFVSERFKFLAVSWLKLFFFSHPDLFFLSPSPERESLILENCMQPKKENANVSFYSRPSFSVST